MRTRFLLGALLLAQLGCGATTSPEDDEVAYASAQVNAVDPRCLALVASYSGTEKVLRYLTPGRCASRTTDLPLNDGIDPARKLTEVARAIDGAAAIFYPGGEAVRDLFRRV